MNSWSRPEKVNQKRIKYAFKTDSRKTTKNETIFDRLCLSKYRPNPFKIVPNSILEPPWTRDGARDASKMLQEDPKMAPRGLRGPQEDPKKAPRGPQPRAQTIP